MFGARNIFLPNRKNVKNKVIVSFLENDYAEVDVLNSTEFIPAPNIEITEDDGGTIGGAVVLEPLSGVIKYKPLLEEINTTVVFNYTVKRTVLFIPIYVKKYKLEMSIKRSVVFEILEMVVKIVNL